MASGLVALGNYYNSCRNKLAGATKEFVSLPIVKEVPFRLGLDLQGGTQLVYEADVASLSENDKSGALDGVRDVIERRVNVFGVSEPIIQVNKTVNGNYRIIAELAGIKDVKEAIKMIGETPLLEFKEKDLSVNLDEGDQKKLEEYNKAVNEQAKKVLAKALAGEDFLTLAKENNLPKELGSEGSPAIAYDGDLGWIDSNSQPAIAKVAKNLAKNQVAKDLVSTPDGFRVIKLEDRRYSSEKKMEEYKVREIYYATMSAADFMAAQDNWKNTELSGKHLKRAVVQFNPNDGSPEVSLEFNDEGAKLFEAVTGRNIGEQVAIFLDGYAISAPTVNEKISGGQAVISGTFSIQEAKLLAQRLNTGALPVPIELISQQTVGATLGMESVNNSVKAGLIGLLLVAIFMIAFYRLPGLLSVFALLVYGLISLALFKLWPVTLTLSGIAGFILSVGMAVDANILIFERLKEEIKNGKPMTQALKDGFHRAWPSIRDSNFTTLIVCFVLIQFSASLVKGFAVTLGLGVIISMFTAIFVTRNFLGLISNRFLEKHSWLVGSGFKKRGEKTNN